MSKVDKRMARQKSKGERAAVARGIAQAPSHMKAEDVGGPLKLQRESSDGTIAKIARSLRRRRPDLGEDPSDEVGASYLAASFIAYAIENNPQSSASWCKVLRDVLEDAGMTLDDDDNDAAIQWVVADLSSRGVLAPPEPQIEVGAIVVALLNEDDSWHEAVVEEDFGEGMFRVLFLEYCKPQDTPVANIRGQDAIADDDGAGDLHQEGDCELCGRHLLLTFHHLIPKDTHPTYINKPSQLACVGIQGEPSRGFLNTYGTMVCRQCHSHIHSLASNVVLAKEFNTLLKILEHPKIHRWVQWAGKQRSGKWAT
jgi:hypothetical protein